jgi:hypothetical protein
MTKDSLTTKHSFVTSARDDSNACVQCGLPESEHEIPKFIDIHTLALVQAAIDILHKTRPLTSVDVELKNAFEQLNIAKEKLDDRWN